MMFVALGGTFVCPLVFFPHATTVPSAFNARQWKAPAASVAAFVSGKGIAAAGSRLSPQKPAGQTAICPATLVTIPKEFETTTSKITLSPPNCAGICGEAFVD